MQNDEELDRCVEIIQEMIKRNERVTIFSDIYKEFKDKITDYVYKNGFENTEEWIIISRAMIYKSTQYLSLGDANAILINLEKIKRIFLLNEQEKMSFDKHIHPLISKVAKEKYFNNHYADSVESAFKEINHRCKKIYKNKTGQEDDGASLMNMLFTPNNPQLIFEDLNTETGKNIQKGYMQIFSGAMTGIRNPKAHENQSLDKESAYRRLVFASLLMDKIDEAIKNEIKSSNSNT